MSLPQQRQAKKDETYYDILKIERTATIAEIVAAYHAAKNAFSKDSVATYSLFNPEEVQEVLGRLEEAYLTLSNLEKRADYDRRLITKDEGGFFENSPSATPNRTSSGGNEPELKVIVGGAESVMEINPDDVSGKFLKDIREKRGLTVDDVSRITKIPSKFLRAIEEDDLKKMPARVYCQGFVKNLASLYKLDPAVAVKGYLAHLDRLSPPTP
jgi:curved DNA-binding protein CbpA